MRIILTGGGTAGHISPALAIIDELRRVCPNSKILFIGRSDGEENNALINAGIEVKTLKIQGLKRKLTPQNLKSIYYALKAKEQAASIIREFSPDVVLGTGGYVCWPVLKAAISMKIPTAIHESNYIPGLTTKMLSPRCDRVFLGYEKAKEHLKMKSNTLTVGTPLREEFYIGDRNACRASLGIKDDELLVLSVGGSIGAGKLNDVMLEVMKSYTSKQKRIKHIHACGKRYFSLFSDSEFANENMGCKIVPYIDDMPTVMRAADVIISRCGASTLAEISAVGVAAILIPSPNVTDNHQLKNAQMLKEAGAAIVIEEKDLSADEVIQAILGLKINKTARKNKAKSIKAFSTPSSAKRIIRELEALILAKKS